jgi:Right handed beta helix region
VVASRVTVAVLIVVVQAGVGCADGSISKAKTARPHAQVTTRSTWPPRAPAAAACRGVRVTASTDLQATVNREPKGTRFCVTRGVHRLSSFVVPKDGDTFAGEPGAILSGARVLRSFQLRDGHWVARAALPENPAALGRCKAPGGNACTFANDVFIDDRPLKRASQPGALAPGRFYADEATHTIVIATNPAGHRVEEAVATRAFKGWRTGVDNVTIAGLVIEKFANEAGIGAINGRPSWKAIGNVVGLNHGGGIQDAGVIRNNIIRQNGQIGVLGSYERGQAVAGNDIGFNNYAGFDPEWEAGGAKWVRSTKLVVRGNRVHDNDGPGLWTDGSSVDVVYDRNVVQRNSGAGILHEISYAAVLRRNVVRGNGFSAAGWLDGAGIAVSSSLHVEISRNTIADNHNGIGIVETVREPPVQRLPPHEARDILVRANSITMHSGHTGLVQDVGDTSYYTGKGIRFVRNSYVLGCNATYFTWRDPSGRAAYANLNQAQWIAAGNDTSGHFTTKCR